MPVIGKTGVEKGLRLIWDGDNLDGDMIPGSLNALGLDWEDVSMHGVSETVRQTASNHNTSDISAQFIMNDNQTAGVYDRSYVLCTDLKTTGTLTVQIGLAGAAPTSGNPEWEGTYILMAAPVSFDSGRAVITATWAVNGSTSPAWGTVA